MEPLYSDPEDEEPMWLHVKCRIEHNCKIFAAGMEAPAAHMAEVAKNGASGSVVDLERTRAIFDLANGSAQLASGLRRMEAARAELVRRGIDPDEAIREIERQELEQN
jgi:hypothetical protein